ncbi:MAG: NAD(P)/FAD-dependent oxidoreductase [Alistipes sp.]|jgi:phytoene dehydrogenase-like protein|nr:NAD(P)/FAD-dependent oxidoreductase [Alistipes sp.]
MHDVVIIGSGLGALVCGAMLSREGLRVRVVEKNARIGGCLQTFTRGGRTFDTGIHYVGGLEEGQILNQYFKFLGVRDRVEVARMDTGAFDTVVSGEREYGLGMGYERFAAGLKGYFPAEADNIDRFCELLRRVGSTMSVEWLRRGVISEGAMRYMELGAAATIDSAFADPELCRVVAGTSMLYGGMSDRTSLYHYGMINHSFIESAWRFVGGAGQLADALAAIIRSHGGEVSTGNEVTAIRLRDDRVSGVEVNGGEAGGGEFIEARHVISDIHPAVTFRLMEKSPRIRKAYTSRLASLANSSAVFTVYLALKPGAMPCLNRNFYIHGERIGGNLPGSVRAIEYDMERDSPRTVMFSMQATRHPFADTASILCPIDFEPFARWEHTHVGQRGAGYLDLKAHLAERIIDFTASRFPELRGAIDHIHTSSPLTWRDYTGSPGGSAYGIAKDWHSPLTTLIPVDTRFENLLLTGQNVNVHGVTGVTVTAALTCARLLGEEYIAKKIGDA